jgi:hypothetical protein
VVQDQGADDDVERAIGVREGGGGADLPADVGGAALGAGQLEDRRVEVDARDDPATEPRGQRDGERPVPQPTSSTERGRAAATRSTINGRQRGSRIDSVMAAS